MALQMSTYNGEKKAWNWEKYIARHVKYHIIIRNLMKYGHQGLNSGSKVWYLMNSIRCEKLSAVATVRAHMNKYQKDFDAVVIFHTQYIDKKAPTLSVKATSVTQTKPAKCRRSAQVAALLKERLSWRSTPEKSMTQCWWHSASSCMNSRSNLGSWRVIRPQRAAKL